MNFVERRFPKEFEKVELLPLSDIHRGHPQFIQKLWDGCKDWLLAAPNRFAVLNGDGFEMAIQGSKGDVYHAMSPDEEYEWLRDNLKPVKHKIICATKGNHDERHGKQTGTDLLKLLCEDVLNVPYSSTGTFLKLVVGGQKDKPIAYTNYVLHGWGGGRETGGALNNAQRLPLIVEADVYITAHHHKPTVSVDAYFKPNLQANTLERRRRLYYIGGSFLDYADYAASKGMRATAPEFPIIDFYADRRWIGYHDGPAA